MPDDRLNADVRARWEENAALWDERMGASGNDFHLQLVRPAVERLLGSVDGQRVLDVACGNGLYARRLVELGAEVVATDVSEAMLDRARQHPSEGIAYRRVDAVVPEQLAALGDGAFDAIVCNEALMTIPDPAPLAEASPGLLKPSGRFVFSTNHPCFNTVGTRFVYEWEEREGVPVERRGVALARYATPSFGQGAAIIGQPAMALYFDRPLNALLRPFFDAGLALDALEEPTFPPRDHIERLDWGSISEIPPILAGRLRRP
jgi:SAM-dependent methyltransferase